MTDISPIMIGSPETGLYKRQLRPLSIFDRLAEIVEECLVLQTYLDQVDGVPYPAMRYFPGDELAGATRRTAGAGVPPGDDRRRQVRRHIGQGLQHFQCRRIEIQLRRFVHEIKHWNVGRGAGAPIGIAADQPESGVADRHLGALVGLRIRRPALSA